MARGTLEARIERLEARKRPMIGAAHRLIVEIGESEAEARRSYELHAGRTIGPNDLIVIRQIVAPS